MAWAKVTVKVPDVNQAFKSGSYNYATPAVKNANVAMMKRINTSYGSAINTYGKLLAIPDGVIISFIASESGGTPVQVTNPSGAAQFDVWGIMAISPAALYDAVKKWKNHVKSEAIPTAITAKIQAKTPGFLKSTSPSAAVLTEIRNALKSDQDFNTMAGCMVLRWLFERFSTLGVTLFNKAIVSYNAGLYQSFLVTDKKTLAPDLNQVDTATLVANTKVPLESRSYLLKVLGTDGFMDLFYRQNLVLPSKENTGMPSVDNVSIKTSSTILGSIMGSIKSSLT